MLVKSHLDPLRKEGFCTFRLFTSWGKEETETGFPSRDFLKEEGGLRPDFKGLTWSRVFGIMR